MSNKQPEEVDIFYILNKIKEGFKKLNVLFFKFIDFVVRRWVVIAVLIAVGAGYGYYLKSTTKKDKTTKLLVRINFDTVNYVYTTIELLNEKLIEKDTAYFKKAGFPSAISTIRNVELKPLIRIQEIVNKYEINNRIFESVLKNVDFESIDEEFDLANTFTADYKQHTMVVSLTNQATDKSITQLLGYINNNRLLQELKKKIVADMKMQIETNMNSIKQIDTILESYTKNNSLPSPSEQLYIVDKDFSIAKVLEKKTELQKEIELLNQELVYAEDIMVLLNKPLVMYEKQGFLSNKVIFYPLLLVGLFLLLSLIRHLFLSLKKIAQES